MISFMTLHPSQSENEKLNLFNICYIQLDLLIVTQCLKEDMPQCKFRATMLPLEILNSDGIIICAI